MARTASRSAPTTAAVNSTTVTMSITVDLGQRRARCARTTPARATRRPTRRAASPCTDVDGDDLTFSKVGGPTDGTATVDADGDWTYTPDRGLPRHRRIHVPRQRRQRELEHVDDVDHRQQHRTTCRSARPTPAPAHEDADQTGTLTCTDADDDLLTYSKVADPTNGSVTVDPDGDWTYDPDPNFNGVDDFTFRAGDGTAFSSTVTMSITVDGGQRRARPARPTRARAPRTRTRPAPSAAPTSRATALTYSKAGDPADGTATVDANGDWTYSPDQDFHGADSFTFRANDGDAELQRGHDVDHGHLGQRPPGVRGPAAHHRQERRRRRDGLVLGRRGRHAGPPDRHPAAEGHREPVRHLDRRVHLHARPQHVGRRLVHRHRQRRQSRLARPRSSASGSTTRRRRAPGPRRRPPTRTPRRAATWRCTDADRRHAVLRHRRPAGPRHGGDQRDARATGPTRRPPTTTAPTASRRPPRTGPCRRTRRRST